MKTENNR